MDEKTIEAMRTVIEGLDAKVEDAYGESLDSAYFANFAIPKATLRAGAEGLRKLVDRAAAGRAEDVAGQGEGARLLDDLIYALNQVTREAEKHGETHVLFKTKGYSYAMYAHNARATILAIEAMLAAKPAEQPQPQAEPTIEECVAAMNRNDYLHASDWALAIASHDAEINMEVGASKSVGGWLIAREKAADAKGGA
jgi:hypothetical protein